MIQDITQSKNIAAELCKLKESAEAANRAKSEFLANMSHELRTPMSAILGFADMMSQTDANAPDPEECIGVIRRNAHHLLQLINEILDLSKIEAGQMTVELLQCDLPTLLSDAIALMRPRAEEKALQLNIRIDGLIPRYVSTDSLKLRQIIVNLLSNAIKFTASGSIETVVRCVVGETSNQLTIEIRDMGIGMSTEQLARIFEPFVQADQSITRKFGGTGLGLTISRRLAHLLNGDVTVSSNVGLGSTFTISITAGAVANSESVSELSNVIPIAADANSFTDGLPLSANILLAEDGRDNQRLLTTHLKMAGAQVTLAENGGIAVELAAAQPFDVILMDMQMPVMDGYCATAELRRRGVKIPIIALTAYAMAEDRNKCLSSGCTDYLSKPVNRNKLLSTIRQYVGVKAAATQSNALASPPQVAGAGEVLRSLYSNYPGMAKIIVEFVNDLPEQVDTLRSLLLRQEMEPLRRLTHQLRGSCGGFGFEAITEIAAAAEDSIRAGRALQHISACIESLIEIIQRIEGYKQVQVRIAS
jgi:CheY-like chemotaxis protein/HPt (histidine-containing phosphotransfer) domain-containing protein